MHPNPELQVWHHFADVLPALDEPVCLGGLLERERPGDDGREALGAKLAHQHLHERRELAAFAPQVPDMQAEHAAIAVDQRHRIETRVGEPGGERPQHAAPFAGRGRREAEDYQPPERREHAVAGQKAAAADWIEDDVDAAPPGDLLHRLRHIGGAVVDDVLDAKLLSAACLPADAVPSTTARRNRASWIAAMPTPPPAL